MPPGSSPEVVGGGRPGGRFTQKKKALVKGRHTPKNEAHVDHVIPRAKGGTNDPENGQVMCRECNIKKSDKEQ
ncbi:HNH endonuclease [Hyalangium rubrum]|uniref:HNH endonuclease n=1 Tax=Hyalangium rubrum TaxID=3103134 RepID=UPI003BF4FA73